MTLPIKNDRDAPAVYGDALGDALTDVPAFWMRPGARRRGR